MKEDCNKTLYCIIIHNIQIHFLIDTQGKDGVNELVIEAVTSMLKLGMFILKSPKLNVSGAFVDLDFMYNLPRLRVLCRIVDENLVFNDKSLFHPFK